MDVSLEEVQELLTALNVLTPKQTNYFLQTMNARQMRILEVLFFNLATNPQGLSTADRKVLSKYKNKIEAIASKDYSHTEKRDILNKRGGFVGALLPILGTLVTSFLTR